jgi:type II secretion system protein D
LLAVLASARGQAPSGLGTRAYDLRYVTPESLQPTLQRFLADQVDPGDAVDVTPDTRARRILVRGPATAQRLAEQFIQALDQPDPRQPQTRSYQAADAEEMNTRIQELRERYASRRDVRVTGDEQAARVMVQAPGNVHREIGAEWQRRVNRDSTGPTTWEPRIQTRDMSVPQARLQHISWEQLARSLRGITGNDALSASPDGTQLELALPGDGDVATTLQIDPQSGEVRIWGDESRSRHWMDVIRALDRPATSGPQESLVRPLVDADHADVTRAVALLRGSAANRSGEMRWGGDVVARMFDQGRAEAAGPQMQLAQAPQPPQGAPAGPGPDLPQPDEGLEPAEGDQAEGGFLGPVRIEFLEGLNMIIIRGQPRDVQRVQAIIDEIERISRETEPAIEIVPLRYVGSDAIAELITELNENVLSARLGDVSITSLVKPNAVLLIGRPESVQSTKDLIARLDVPVEPAAQFRVFQLSHMPAVDAERAITASFPEVEENPGLGPRVRVLADFRSNSVIVYASPRDLEQVADLLSKIDVPASGTVSEVRVFKLKNALAEELQEVLETILRADPQQQQGLGFQAQQQQGAGALTQARSSPRATMLTLQTLDAETKQLLESGILTDVTVAADTRANSLVVTAPRNSMELIAELVRQLDQLPTADAEIRVFVIKNGDASSLVEMLSDLFEQQQQQQGGPAVQTAGGGESTLVPLRFSLDLRTNSIIASGSSADLVVVEAILLKLETEDVAVRKSTVYRLQNVDAQTVADAITEFLTTERDILLQAGETPALTPFEQIEREVVVVPEVVSNSLIISATDRYFNEIVRIIEEIDEQPPMVLINVLIAQIAMDTTEQLGIELGLQDSLLFDRSAIIENILVPGFNFNATNLNLGNSAREESLRTREKAAGQALSNFAVGRQDSELGYGGLVLSASSESVSVLIRALAESTRLDILSRPQIMALNNQEAFVQVGSLVPYIQDAQLTQFGTINSTTLQEVGLILRVIPRITDDGLVVMAVSAQDSELNRAEGVTISVIDGVPIVQPSIDIRVAQTVVTARDGQTIILGGLITKDRLSQERKVPYLGDIPVLGRLFRYDNLIEDRAELLIILTPHVIRGQEDIDRVNAAEYARMSWCLADALSLQGDMGLGGTVPGVPGEIIYPDLNPAGQPVPGSAVPAPESIPVPQRMQTPLPAPLRTPPALPPDVPPTEPPLPGSTEIDEAAESPSVLAAPQNRITGFWKRMWKRTPAKPRAGDIAPAGPLPSLDQPSVSRVGFQQSNEPGASETMIRRLDQLPAVE